VLASPRPAHADRYEATLSIRPTRGSARIWEAGTGERAEVWSRGAAASLSLGVRDWLDLGGELAVSYFDEASYQMATLPVSANDPADADADGTCHDPDRDQIRELLVKYFDPPITDEVVDRVEADYRKVRSSQRDRLHHARYYGATRASTRWRGMTWYEDLNGAERSLRLSDLVLMRADVLSDAARSFPRPRRFCPVFCVGTWEQIEPRPRMGERYLWQLSADGRFRCDDPRVPSTLTRWCVHRDPGFGSTSCSRASTAATTNGRWVTSDCMRLKWSREQRTSHSGSIAFRGDARLMSLQHLARRGFRPPRHDASYTSVGNRARRDIERACDPDQRRNGGDRLSHGRLLASFESRRRRQMRGRRGFAGGPWHSLRSRSRARLCCFHRLEAAL
jgi:hypothetical protein